MHKNILVGEYANKDMLILSQDRDVDKFIVAYFKQTGRKEFQCINPEIFDAKPDAEAAFYIRIKSADAGLNVSGKENSVNLLTTVYH